MGRLAESSAMILSERADILGEQMMNGLEHITTKSVLFNQSVGDVHKRSGEYVITVRR